jgi:hypothetical protein
MEVTTMAEIAPGRKQFDPQKESHVGIKDHDQDPKRMKVTRPEFWVSKDANEAAEWFCQRGHKHSDNPPCFTIKFDKKNGSPFQSPGFKSNPDGYACSDDIVVAAGKTIYEYRVVAHAKDDLDPGGGVKP